MSSSIGKLNRRRQKAGFYKLWQRRNSRKPRKTYTKEAKARPFHSFPADGILHSPGAGEPDRPRRSEWPLVILKELIDNALDACEEAGDRARDKISVAR